MVDAPLDLKCNIDLRLAPNEKRSAWLTFADGPWQAALWCGPAPPEEGDKYLQPPFRCVIRIR